jgi:large subunit ribosomal protein L22
MANAQENHDLAPDQLRIATIMVDEGPRLKRMQARAMGRGNRIIKKTSHITVVVEDYEAPRPVKPHGTKPKPRPTFAAPAAKGGKKKGAEKPVPEGPEVTDTAVEAVVAAEPEAAAQAPEPTPEEATPVTESEAPEEAGSASPVEEQEETTPQAEGATGEAEASDEKGAE